LDAGFGLQIQSCMHLPRLARNPWRKPLATISTKGCIDTDRVYQPGFAVYITLAPRRNQLMKFEERILINAPIEKLFSLYTDVSGWSSWDPDVKSSSIDGQFLSLIHI
jgi:hypothetical protein